MANFLVLKLFQNGGADTIDDWLISFGFTWNQLI